jgi:hypothetical protein
MRNALILLLFAALASAAAKDDKVPSPAERERLFAYEPQGEIVPVKQLLADLRPTGIVPAAGADIKENPVGPQIKSRLLAFDKAAKSFLYFGKPYKPGAAGPDAFDCSGLVKKVLEDFLALEHKASSQWRQAKNWKARQKEPYFLRALGKDELPEPGDLVFFGGRNVNHVGFFLKELPDGRIEVFHAAGRAWGVLANAFPGGSATGYARVEKRKGFSI